MATQQLSLAGLLIQTGQAAIYQAALNVATTIGLPVSSWQPGDPTRSLFYLQSEILESLENVVVGFIQSGFLDYASQPNADGSTNPWLAILAQQVFGYTVPSATAATTQVTLTNTQGGLYDIDAGDLTFENSSTGATYTNTTAVTLTPVGTSGAVGSVTVVANTTGSAGSADAGAIDTLLTSFLGVTCSNPAAAVGTDQQAPATTVQQCRNKLGSLSPNGPASAYSFVALNSALTGVSDVTRARTYPDSETGQVQIYIAGASGAVSSGDVSAVQAAIQTYATPLCITPTVASATNAVIDVAYSLWVYASVNQTQAAIISAIQTELEDFFEARPIGGDILPGDTTGALYQSMIGGEITSVYPQQTLRVLVSAPSTDTALTAGQVAVLGTLTGTIYLVPDPT